jgi:hypothetical protein
MPYSWQDFAAIAIVLGAASYLLRLAGDAVFRKRSSGCGSGCGSCAAQVPGNASGAVGIVTIGPVAQKPPNAS